MNNSFITISKVLSISMYEFKPLYYYITKYLKERGLELSR